MFEIIFPRESVKRISFREGYIVEFHGQEINGRLEWFFSINLSKEFPSIEKYAVKLWNEDGSTNIWNDISEQISGRNLLL